MEQEEQKENLKKFLLNNEDLENLEETISEFNIFETMNISNAEIDIVIYLLG